VETDEEREEAKRQIAILNAEVEARETRMNGEWKATPEWAQLRERELREGREMRATAKRASTVPGMATHSYKCEYKLQKIPKGKKGGVDSWRYIKHVARPLPVRNEWL